MERKLRKFCEKETDPIEMEIGFAELNKEKWEQPPQLEL